MEVMDCCFQFRKLGYERLMSYKRSQIEDAFCIWRREGLKVLKSSDREVRRFM